MAVSAALPLLQVIIGFALMETIYAQPSLSVSYYTTTCPPVHNVVDRMVKNAVSRDRSLAASILRMHFHDCFVRGCDASVLIDSVPPQIAEKDGLGNLNSLRGFEVIDDVKRALERVCPGVVSCADVLALAARSAIYRIGGPSWKLPLGRRDGNVSNAGETVFNLPPPFALYPQLINMFAAKGLSEHDMIVLSGAHTIGNTHCYLIESRLYNSTSPGGVDPNLTSSYAAQLKARCPNSGGKSLTTLPMDPTLGNDFFDNNYFRTVRANRGVFISDAALINNSSGARIVRSLSYGNYPFFWYFSNAMTRMSSVQVVLAPDGEVRQNCRIFNPTMNPTHTPGPSTKSPTPSPTAKPTTPAPSQLPPTRAPKSNAPTPTPRAPVPAKPPRKAPAPAPTAKRSSSLSKSGAPAPVQSSTTKS